MPLRSVMRLMIYSLIVLLGAPRGLYAQFGLADVIKNVRQNEILYQDIEVVMQSNYEITHPARSKNEVIKRQSKTRFISQGDLIRLEREGGIQDSQGTKSQNRIEAFDGKTSRVFEQKAIGNITNAPLDDAAFIRPHLILIRYSNIAIPFSVYLSGHKAIQAHRSGRWDPRLSMEVTYEGEDILNGLKCHKVLVKKISAQSGALSDGEEFWLAEARNYLPIKLVCYTYRVSRNAPVGYGVVNDIREIKPGIWFPFGASVFSYNKIKLKRDSRQEVQWKEEFVVDRANLDPTYDRSFFTTVTFPKGTAVYEVENKKIVRSWREGAPGVPGGPVKRTVFGSWRIILGSLLALAAVLLAGWKLIAAKKKRALS